MNYVINGHKYTKKYYLVDVNYQDGKHLWRQSQTRFQEKIFWFTQCQDACRKDVKQAFDVLQAQFSIV
jgi:hypothetical protein